MRIEHIALWARDIEKLRTFYEKYFSATASGKYTNSAKRFSSYFLRRIQLSSATESNPV